MGGSVKLHPARGAPVPLAAPLVRAPKPKGQLDMLGKKAGPPQGRTTGGILYKAPARHDRPGHDATAGPGGPPGDDSASDVDDEVLEGPGKVEQEPAGLGGGDARSNSGAEAVESEAPISPPPLAPAPKRAVGERAEPHRRGIRWGPWQVAQVFSRGDHVGWGGHLQDALQRVGRTARSFQKADAFWRFELGGVHPPCKALAFARA